MLIGLPFRRKKRLAPSWATIVTRATIVVTRATTIVTRVTTVAVSGVAYEASAGRMAHVT